MGKNVFCGAKETLRHLSVTIPNCHGQYTSAPQACRTAVLSPWAGGVQAMCGASFSFKSFLSRFVFGSSSTSVNGGS